MSKRYWITVIAFGLAANFAFAQSGQRSEDNMSETSRQEQQRERKPFDFGIPVRILNHPEESDRSKRDQEKSEQRDIEVLIAQKSMAKSTDMIVTLTIWQFFLAALGTFALVYSIKLNRDATRAAIKSAKLAQTAIGLDRAWMSYHKLNAGIANDIEVDGVQVKEGFVVRIIWVNSGKTPSLKTCNTTQVMMIAAGEELPLFKTERPEGVSKAPIPPGGELIGEMKALNDDETRQFRDGTHRLIVYSRVEYHEIFSLEERVSELCGQVMYGGEITENAQTRIDWRFIPVGDQQTMT